MDTTQAQQSTVQYDQILPKFQETLNNHGLDTTKLDDPAWREIVNEVEPLFTSRDYAGGGSFDR